MLIQFTCIITAAADKCFGTSIEERKSLMPQAVA